MWGNLMQCWSVLDRNYRRVICVLLLMVYRQLSWVPSFKYLGVYIDENLTWQKHTRYVYQRVQSRLHCLYCLCSLSSELLGKLYCTFVVPVLDCCDVVWSPSPVQYFKDLNVFTQSFAHWFWLLKVFCAMHWLNVEDSISLLLLQNSSPAYLRGTFKYSTTVTIHVGRNSHCLFVPKVRTTHGKNSLYYKGTQIWNSLNALLYTAAILGQFKHLYKSYF